MFFVSVQRLALSLTIPAVGLGLLAIFTNGITKAQSPEVVSRTSQGVTIPPPSFF
jgi:hypothetical protein